MKPTSKKKIKKFNPLKILIDGSPERDAWKYGMKIHTDVVEGIRTEINLMIDKNIEYERYHRGNESQKVAYLLDFKSMIKNLFNSY